MLRLLFVAAAVLVFSTPVLAGEPPKQRHQLIDQGPFVQYTIEAQWPRHNIAYKGVAIRLKSGGLDKGGFLFDTDLMRMSAAWSGGFLQFDRDVATIRDYRSISFVGNQIAGTPQIPGGGLSQKLSEKVFTDPRAEPFGPLPRDWAHYRGLYVSGDQVVLSYTLGATPILETPAIESVNGVDAITRTFSIGEVKANTAIVLSQRHGCNIAIDGLTATLRRKDAKDAATDRIVITMDRVDDNWERLSMGAPGKSDFLTRTKELGILPVNGFPKPGVIEGPAATASPLYPGAVPGSLQLLKDGGASMRKDDYERCVWFDGPQARFSVDLKASKDIRQVDTFSWHADERAPQLYQLYASSEETPDAAAKEPTAAGWTLLASVDTRSQGEGGMHGVSIARPAGVLGKFRHLLWVAQPPKAGSSNGTYFCEVDVYSTDDAPKFPDRRLPIDQATVIGLAGKPERAELKSVGDETVILELAAGPARQVKVVMWNGEAAQAQKVAAACAAWPAGNDLATLTKGGPRRWDKTLETKGKMAADNAAYVVDTIVMPDSNPWNAWFRPGAFDFFSDGTSAAVSNWSGDVWVVKGIDEKLEKLSWQRVATGFYNPLGLKIVNDQIYVLGRDQITRVHDLNGDGEADFYENFNNDVAATWNFHEFAFDLQTDAEGNFYYAKGGPVRSGGRGFERIAAHHGCVLKVSKDGATLERVVTGLRAPNGIAIGPGGEITTGENEGTWVPACKINWLKPGGFSGVVDTAHRPEKPTTYDPPLCWLPREVDNSGGGQAWVTSDKWGPFKGEVLHLSYGTCSLYKVLKQDLGSVIQGGVVRIPVTFDSGVMRMRFNARDGQLYVAGLKGWQTTAGKDGCFQRVRYTGKPVNMASDLEIRKDEIWILFTDALDKTEAAIADNYSVEQWNYIWSEAYGSADYSVSNPKQKKRDTLAVKAVEVSANGKAVRLVVPGLQPVMQMKIKYKLNAADGSRISQEISNTIHKIP
ncbi:MAG TPA: DUF6797 domain-containing protein [Planctomycetota bacterium]|nr:DUF6797 domain-containing protein [Planctomycetota bacterium]